MSATPADPPAHLSLSPLPPRSPTSSLTNKRQKNSGKIASIDITAEGETKSATVTFEKETAARTALLLNNTSLGGNEISVSGNVDTSAADDEAAAKAQEGGGEAAATADRAAEEEAAAPGSPVLTQEEKPRARILAEVLAHGYLVADTGLQKAIALDEKHGVSARFLATLRRLDERTQAARGQALDQARAADASYGLTQRASSLLTGLSSYFERASNTPTGRRIVDFYTTSQRQVQDVHNEARRLAELKKGEAGGSLYKAVGLDKVLGRFHQPGAAPAAGSEKEGAAAAAAAAPGAAPTDAAATESAEKPTAPSGVGNPETIH